jgi:hypothetical protein
MAFSAARIKAENSKLYELKNAPPASAFAIEEDSDDDDHHQPFGTIPVTTTTPAPAPVPAPAAALPSVPVVPKPVAKEPLKSSLAPANAVDGLMTFRRDEHGNEILTAPSSSLTLTGMCALDDDSIARSTKASAEAIVAALEKSAVGSGMDRLIFAVEKLTNVLEMGLKRIGDVPATGGGRRRPGVASAASGLGDDSMTVDGLYDGDASASAATTSTPRIITVPGVPTDLISQEIPPAFGIPVLRRNAILPGDLTKLPVSLLYVPGSKVVEHQLLAGDKAVHVGNGVLGKVTITLSPSCMAVIKTKYLEQTVPKEEVDRDRRPSVLTSCAWLLEPSAPMSAERWEIREKMGGLTPNGAEKPGYFMPGVGLMACFKSDGSITIQVAIAHAKADGTTNCVAGVNNKVENYLFSQENWFDTSGMRILGVKNAIKRTMNPTQIGENLVGLITVIAPNGDPVTVPVISQHLISHQIASKADSEPTTPRRPGGAARRKPAASIVVPDAKSSSSSKNKRRAMDLDDDDDKIEAAAEPSSSLVRAIANKKRSQLSKHSAPKKVANIDSDVDSDDDDDDDDESDGGNVNSDSEDGDHDGEQSDSDNGDDSDDDSDDDSALMSKLDDDDDDDGSESFPSKKKNSSGNKRSSSSAAPPTKRPVEDIKPPSSSVAKLTLVDSSEVLLWFDNQNPYFKVIKKLCADNMKIIRATLFNMQKISMQKLGRTTSDEKINAWTLTEIDRLKSESLAYWKNIKDNGMQGIVACAADPKNTSYKMNIMLWLTMSMSRKWTKEQQKSAQPVVFKDRAYFEKTGALFANQLTGKFIADESTSSLVIHQLPIVANGSVSEFKSVATQLIAICSDTKEGTTIEKLVADPADFESYLLSTVRLMSLAINVGVLIANCT